MSAAVTTNEANAIGLPCKARDEQRSIAAILKTVAAMQTINVDGGFQPR